MKDIAVAIAFSLLLWFSIVAMALVSVAYMRVK